MELSLEGQVALVTGGSRGIGRAIGAAFAAAGAKVMLSSRRQDKLDEAAAAMAGDVDVVVANAGEPDQAAHAVAATVRRFGGLTILVNNAATNPYFGPLMGISPSQMAKSTQVNQQAVVTWTQEAVKAGLGESGGSVLNIASVGGLAVDPSLGYYSATKAAVLHLTRQLAAELAPRIRVNAIAPGLVKTDMARALWEPNEAAMADRMPLKRLGEPADVANAAVFLVSDAASWVTGSTLVVDGGALLAAVVT